MQTGNPRTQIAARLNKAIAARNGFPSDTGMTKPSIAVEQEGGTARVIVSGEMLTQSLSAVEDAFRATRPDAAHVTVDMSEIDALDTGGAWLIADLKNRCAAMGATVAFDGLKPAHSALLETVSENIPKDIPAEAPPKGFMPWLESLGQSTVGAGRDTMSILGFLGLTLHRLGRTMIMPWRLRRAAVVSQMEETGFKALPIVALMGFLIGVVLAFQGATQLKQFGAEIFVVELISISVLRELGILLTAIIVAGRSGSAFTASIGSMKVQEEIDAMRTLGLDPIEVLVIPRVLALLIMLPILGFVADIAGLFGGALMSWIDLGVSPGMFITRLKENTSVWHLAVGLIKAPFFAMVIGVIACWQAMQVKGSAQSVGQRTTASVVQSIFMVIAIDALFSIFFSEIGV